jgi:protein arginine kinase activator
MKCEKCGNNIATTHIHTVINGKVCDQNLCGYCASLSGAFGFGDLRIINMLANTFEEGAFSSKDGDERKCSSCGSTFADIAALGLVGCPDCYKTFYSGLMPTIRRIHGRNVHVGKIPYSSAPRLSQKTRIETLKKQMDDAVKQENFELAASLRDRIKIIEKEG